VEKNPFPAIDQNWPVAIESASLLLGCPSRIAPLGKNHRA